MFESFSLSHPGQVREVNEDSVIANPELRLWVVADGVGGQSHGDAASQMTVQTVEREIRQGSSLHQALVRAHQVLREAIANESSLEGMATTVIACRLHSDRYELAWVGDSRAYLLTSQGIFRLTRDHNRAQQLVDVGELSEEQAWNHPSQFELTQALGQIDEPRIERVEGVIEEGEYLLLCSDGLSSELTDLEIYSYLDDGQTCELIAEQLRDAALAHGGSDNITVVLIRACAPRLGTEPSARVEIPVESQPVNGKKDRLVEDSVIEQPHYAWQMPRTMVLLVILVSAIALYLTV